MKESVDLRRARDHLNKAQPLNSNAAYHIEEGFLLLEDLSSADTPERSTAENLGRTYVVRFHSILKEKLNKKHISQPDTESLLRSAGALETTTFSREVDIESLRLGIASRLIDSYFQGYSDEERSKTIADLMDNINKPRETRS